MKEKHKLITTILKSGIITWILLLVIWNFGALFYTDDFLPGPLVTLKGMAGLITDGTLEKDIIFSLARVLKGWLLGLLFAIPAGLCVGYFKPIGYVMEPFLNFFRFIPAIGFITLFLLWFGVGESSKVALIFYAVIFPVMVNTIAGVRTVDQSLIEAAQSMGAGRSKIFFTVILPSAVPNIFTGVRLGLSGAIICIVAAEMLAASEGIGYLIYTSRLYYRTDWIFTGIFTLGVIGLLADKLLRLIGKHFLYRFGVR
ncbi:MAG: ABC transporter permease [Lachnospiraceae bacterium]|nr:ABC transporter permease [Lachnospiraceae bacterium]